MSAPSPSAAIPSASISGRNPIAWFRAWRRIRQGRKEAQRIYARYNPAAVIGFGGYPALPALLAAVKAGVPTAIHEQNAVLGRVNRFLAPKRVAFCRFGSMVVRLGRVTDGTKPPRMLGNLGAPACVGDRLTLI